MRIVYHLPSQYSVYAQRTIYHGFKNAFIDLGHDFYTFTNNDDLKSLLQETNPDILITASHFFYRKHLDYDLLKKFRNNGMVMFTKLDYWNSPLPKARINEPKSLSKDIKTVELIKAGLLGDVFFHVVEQGDERMEGFEEATGYPYYTIPLAADKTIYRNECDRSFQADVSYVGTYLSSKQAFFDEYVFPLRKKYDLKIYGQDWTFPDRMLGWLQRFGQYYNIPYIRSIRKPKLQLDEERKIYSSSTICINVHEEQQRIFGGDCNERTFKIPLCGGFEVSDNVACIRKYFKEEEEIIISNDKQEWFEKIDHYLKNPDERMPIIRAGAKRVLMEHTYHNRVLQILRINEQVKGN